MGFGSKKINPSKSMPVDWMGFPNAFILLVEEMIVNNRLSSMFPSQANYFI
jgi:hypothetical protein